MCDDDCEISKYTVPKNECGVTLREQNLSYPILPMLAKLAKLPSWLGLYAPIC